MSEYKPTKASKDAEKAVKDPFIAEHNAMGAKFRVGKITPAEWGIFKVDWEKRFYITMAPALKNRALIEVAEDAI